MKSQYYKLVLFFSLIFLVSCAAQQVVQAPPAFKPIDLNPMVRSGEYLQKVNNFLVILDASGTMQGAEFNTAKEVVKRMVLTIPDLRLKSGLRSFGSSFGDQNYMLYGMADHDKAKFNASLPGFAGQGASPLGDSITAAGSDLKGTTGQCALIVVSDGIPTIEPSAILGPKAAEALKKQYGDRLCIYTVHVGDNADGRAIMDNIAKAGICGSAVRAGDIMSPEGMANFVERVFLEKAPSRPSPPPPAPKPAPAPPPPPPIEKDSDNDGVPDSRDKCPGTPAGVTVDKDGCPLDSDRDGVPDYLDKCPGTPIGVTVDKDGCPPPPRVIDRLTLQILFDTDRATITEASQKELQKAVAFVKKYPGSKIEVEGHTDSVGPDTYNMKLSERRATTVKDYLIKEAGVNSSKIKAIGFGESKPVADNKTAAGRTQNRRVEILILSD